MKRLVAVLLVVASSSFAASWKSEGPFFGNVLSIAVDPANPDRLWVSTHGGGVWRSVDGGGTWKLSGKELSDRVVSYVVLQPRSNTLWAGVERSTLARSKDGGQTWEWISNDLAYTPFPPAFDPANPKAIWIADVNLHKRSSDGGVKWTEFRVTGGDVRVFAFHPKNSKIMWAGGSNTRSGLWKTTDGGVTWKQLGKGLPESNAVQKLLVDPANADNIYMTGRRGGYKSTDGGESWTPFSGFPADEEVESLTIHPSSSETLFAGTRKGFLKTTDGAESWTRVGGGLPRYIISAMAIHPSSPDMMWVGASGAGIYKSTDGGKSWTEANRGFAASWIDNVWGDATGTIFVKARSATFRGDGKGSWTETDKTFDTVVFDGKNPKTIHAGFAWTYYRSTDGGVTWNDVAKPFQEPRPIFNSVVLDAKNPKVLYSADSSTSDDEPPVFKSVDGGVKWKPANRGVTGSGIVALQADSAGALVALGNEGGLFHSVDGATTWTAGGGGLPAKDLKGMAIDPSNPSRIYVTSKEGFYRSEDGGATFSTSKLEPEGVAVDGKGNVYAATGKGVSRSTDGGKTWTSFNDGLTNTDVRSIYSAGTRLYAGTAGGGVFSIELD